MLSWTDQGVRTVKDTPKRIQAARERAKKLGVEIKQVFLTTGEFDILVIAEAADGDNMAKIGHGGGRGGERAHAHGTGLDRARDCQADFRASLSI